MPTHFQRLHEYETWAGGEVIASLRATQTLLGEALGNASHPPTAAFRRASGIFAHTQMARHEWLSRLGAVERRPWAMFPEWTIEQCQADAQRLDRLWADYLARAEAERLDEVVTYYSTEGKPFTSTRGDILTHVYNHSSYHRGQIAMLVKQAGGTPASTDFIVYIRRARG